VGKRVELSSKPGIHISTGVEEKMNRGLPKRSVLGLLGRDSKYAEHFPECHLKVVSLARRI
jgi:hypothetical protein